MKKSLIIMAAALMFFVTQVGVASFIEEGPYLELDSTEENPNNFFMLDVDEGFSLEAKLPNMMPVDGKITSRFGWRRGYRRYRRGKRYRRYSRLHKGLDIAAKRGTPIYAPADGRVTFVGRKGGYGNTVMLDHGGNLSTLFAHNHRMQVKEGELVVRGEKIAEVGSTGRSTGPHLHYEVRIAGRPVNPAKFLN